MLFDAFLGKTEKIVVSKGIQIKEFQAA